MKPSSKKVDIFVVKIHTEIESFIKNYFWNIKNEFFKHKILGVSPERAHSKPIFICKNYLEI